ncbi:N-acetylmannosamine-6-phosphate 2-epimerase [Vacuolonema iberomarrocanum]|uniref:N-acetylmannosamine-6-phosphate 2-epimerase n=1 Tax=Vacuolonema iberomarrocanum TaxID=3454632 RepID=UPI0019F14449|nr:N-acetylmannosamine-6-phosphate 2-epimerase [filamentous cyanobacterium LEGE 07170]
MEIVIANLVEILRRKLVVSCQAPADSPLHDPHIIAAIAQAAVDRGAVAVRIDSPPHIQAVRRQVSVPIIGLWKRQFPDSEVYITPQFRQAQAVALAGADMIAIDATLRPRPGGISLPELIARIHTDLKKPVMADIDTVESAIAAATAGADFIGTTLYGYTSATQDQDPPGFEILQELTQTLKHPVICEGGIATPAMARKALDLGAHCVVVGTAITGVDAQTRAFCAALGNPSFH